MEKTKDLCLWEQGEGNWKMKSANNGRELKVSNGYVYARFQRGERANNRLYNHEVGSLDSEIASRLLNQSDKSSEPLGPVHPYTVSAVKIQINNNNNSDHMMANTC